MVTSRSRSGRANADWKPAWRAAAANEGQRPDPGVQVLVFDALAGAEGVQARAFLGLQLEQLQQAHRLAGGGHQRQAALGRGQHHPGGGDAKQADAPVRQPGQQVHDVIVIHQGTGNLHQ